MERYKNIFGDLAVKVSKNAVYGTGMGLYLSKKIIEEGHNGTIWAESKGIGKGATFYMKLNVA